MRGLNNRTFFNLWNLVLAATNPGLSRDRWTVGTVTWKRQRHSFRGPDFSFVMDVYTLDRNERGKRVWQLLMVVENWWDADREPVRSAVWARALSGSQQAIVNWFRQQEKSLPRET
ncbi:MAG: hypothetical protein WCF16_13240 [Alphaproteobacteria bacterium]